MVTRRTIPDGGTVQTAIARDLLPAGSLTDLALALLNSNEAIYLD
ncbi:MAG: hypothetical protein QF405_09075 [Roseibacillus sp.]|nr:hypothetical protein [Roseibacillus sp.]MDP7307776.1 hypothetical protein [Roseibacillus sp.]MDP7496805.1 hypothetical protein [Roseibacillus sp.]HJM62706.1 hypothetical protein [Roseibacillus sp.]